MTDEDFRYWKQWVERHVEGYDEIARAVFIEGFSEGDGIYYDSGQRNTRS